MAHINLLPWREELRARKQKEFGILAGVAVVAMIGVMFGVHLYFQQLIDYQNRRNSFLESEIAKVDEKIKEIQELESEKERLLARMEIIQQLQSSRPEIVHLMDEFVGTLPEGVFYTKVEQKGRTLNFEGVAQSNARVSSLMRRLDGSEWMNDPALIEIKRGTAARADDDLRMSTFSLSIKQSEQADEDEDDDGGSS